VRILVVDDDVAVSRVMAIMLQRAGYEVALAADGRQGVDAWENGGVDLIMMDVQMPRMDGFEATRLIREKERERGGHTPIVAVTAFALREDEKKCLAAGMDSYLSKPIDFQKCLEMVHTIIGWRD
jgi:CheY-like chemotaxis protein